MRSYYKSSPCASFKSGGSTAAWTRKEGKSKSGGLKRVWWA